MLQIVGVLAGLASLACWIMTLIRMFGDKTDGGTLKGVLGILCPIWAFIWGWMTVGKHKTNQLMLVWSAVIAVGIIVNVMTFPSGIH
jgi:hypothetical protein